MSMNPCMAFFEANRDNRDKVKSLIECGLGNDWFAAGLSASPHSPSPISLQEVIVRQVHTPLHWDSENAEVKLGFYDDLTRAGLSVNRLSHALSSDLSDNSEQRAEERGRSALGFIITDVEHVCALLTADGQPSGAVFDTANEDDISHADVCATRGKTRLETRGLRYQLFEGLKDRFRKGRIID